MGPKKLSKKNKKNKKKLKKYKKKLEKYQEELKKYIKELEQYEEKKNAYDGFVDCSDSCKKNFCEEYCEEKKVNKKYKDKKKKCHGKCIKAKKWEAKKTKAPSQKKTKPTTPTNAPTMSYDVIDPVTINFEQTLRISIPKQMNTAQQIVYTNTIVNIVEASNTNVQATCVVTDQKVTKVSGRRRRKKLKFERGLQTQGSKLQVTGKVVAKTNKFDTNLSKVVGNFETNVDKG